MRAVSSERVAKRNGEGRKEKKIGWWVPCMEKKEREKNGIRLRKEISFGGVEAEEKEEKKDGKKR